MRTTITWATVFVAAAAAAGCKSENELRYTATLQAETAGVAMSDDGLDAFAAMAGTTCTIDANWGCPTDDEDLPTEEEQVADHFGHETLGVSSEGVHTITDGVWLPEADLAVTGVKTASLVEGGGNVAIGLGDDGCFAEWSDGDVVAVPDAACAEGARYSVDRHTGTMFVAGDGQMLAVERAVTRDLGVPGDLVAWDPVLELLYTAESGTRELRALTSAGAEEWSVTTSGDIASIAARGDRGEVLALVSRDDLGGMERRDGETGRLLGSSAMPDDDGHIAVSLNGIKIAVVRDDMVHFFALDPEGEAPVVDPTPPVCINPLDRAQRD